MNHVNDSPLAIFEMISSSVDKNIQAVKEAEARGHVQSQMDELYRTAPGQQKQANAQSRFDLDYLLKTAEAIEIAAEYLTKTSSLEPAGMGARDNEGRGSPMGGYFQPSEASSLSQTGKGGLETDERGPNRIHSNEDKNWSTTAYPSALGPQVDGSRDSRAGLIQKIQKAAGVPTHTHDGNLTRDGLINLLYKAADGAVQPPGFGPKDNEGGFIPSALPDSDTIRRDTVDVIKQPAQKEQLNAKDKEFPLTEPQARENTVASGSGAGPTNHGSPDPEKVAAARAYLMDIANRPDSYEYRLYKQAMEEAEKAKECTCKGKNDCKYCKEKAAEKAKKDDKKSSVKESQGMDMADGMGM